VDNPSFILTVEKTYYNSGFFNISVNYEKYFGSNDEDIEILCGNNPKPIIGKINRTDNPNKTPRIKGGKELKYWFKENSEVMGKIKVEIISKNKICLKVIRIDDLLKKINFDDYYIEATFQFKLLMQLGKIYDENKIFPERHIKAYDSKIENYTKKEIDIVIEQENNLNIAIELKMPMNGQVPEQMFKFVEDIKFLEELNTNNLFYKCYLIVVTNDRDFWQGSKNNGIYSYFRNNNILKGKISKPTGKDEIKATNYYELNGEYKIQWNDLANNFRYFVIEIDGTHTTEQ